MSLVLSMLLASIVAWGPSQAAQKIEQNYKKIITNPYLITMTMTEGFMLGYIYYGLGVVL